MLSNIILNILIFYEKNNSSRPYTSIKQWICFILIVAFIITVINYYKYFAPLNFCKKIFFISIFNETQLKLQGNEIMSLIHNYFHSKLLCILSNLATLNLQRKRRLFNHHLRNENSFLNWSMNRGVMKAFKSLKTTLYQSTC